ncbi:MAG: Gfo/Idh/MocA family oxidoreductase, partial [Planctomycetota bacterium]
KALRLNGREGPGTGGAWARDPRQSGGALVKLQIHDLDYAAWILGRPETVFTQSLRSPENACDHPLTILAFTGGALASLEASYLMPQGFCFRAEFSIVGEAGMLEYGNQWDRPLRLFLAGGKEYSWPEVSTESAYLVQMRHFLRCIREQRESDVITAWEAREALRYSLASLASAESGTPQEL